MQESIQRRETKTKEEFIIKIPTSIGKPLCFAIKYTIYLFLYDDMNDINCPIMQALL